MGVVEKFKFATFLKATNFSENFEQLVDGANPNSWVSGQAAQPVPLA